MLHVKTNICLQKADRVSLTIQRHCLQFIIDGERFCKKRFYLTDFYYVEVLCNAMVIKNISKQDVPCFKRKDHYFLYGRPMLMTCN